MMKEKIYNRKKNKDFYKMFNKQINYNMTKEYIIENNNKRLNKEVPNLSKLKKNNK